jgi:A/G-specific adenine glycosylase
MLPATDRDSVSTRFTAIQKKNLRRRLLAWYANHARDLPWRGTSNPYHVWVSEIMLQQTQVGTVRDYFERFIRTLPTIERLAAAEEQDVLRLWEGLGYYRRARQLHAAARQVIAEHSGRLPDNTDELMRLPGIGRYTAGAIASIAFGRRAPILEANTIRLLSRLIAYHGDVTTAAAQRALWETAERILPRQRIAAFNQALMELGALVCTPAAPRCDKCPLAAICAARASGMQEMIPLAKLKPATVELHEAAIVVLKNGCVLVRQCGHGERWSGLWDFPRFAIESDGPLFAHDEIIVKVRQQTGITCTPGALLFTMKHGVTRYRITLDCYRSQFVKGRLKAATRGAARWVSLSQLADYPLSTTGRKIAKSIEAVFNDAIGTRSTKLRNTEKQYQRAGTSVPPIRACFQ